MFAKNKFKKGRTNSGFTFVELIVGVAVFLILVVSVYDAYISIFNVVGASRAKIAAIDLANEQLEIVRNMPYANVGISGGIPSGVLSHTQNLTRDTFPFVVTTTVRNVDDPFDGTLGGTPNDTAPADFKIVELEISCDTCKNFSPISVTTRVAPKNLENTSNNGALFVKAFDANGNPISGASVHIENNTVIPPIVVDDFTNNQGMLQIVDVPPGTNAYEISVTKNGYSTDKTYSSTVSNPYPTKPNSTVATQQVTQLSFVIDKLSNFSVYSMTDMCVSVPGINFSLSGSKTIGTNPIILKYDQDKTTDSNGFISIPNIEWDTYNFANNSTSYDLVGTNPLFPVSLLPDSSKTIQMIFAPKNPDTLMLTVEDSSTGLPLSGVSVLLTKTGFSSTKITGQGFMGQTDWSGGGGQATSTDSTKYLESDGNVEISNPVGDVTLKKYFGEYVPSGVLTSSSFDTGIQGNFQQIEWTPVDQPVGTSVRFQIATNNDGGTWNYTGPDGTASTYYTNADKNIHSSNNGNQFLRYKMFLDTTSTSTAPNISSVYFTFTSSCTPPGQVYFSGLSSGSYNINVSKTGYISQDVPINIGSAWQSSEIIMQPN